MARQVGRKRSFSGEVAFAADGSCKPENVKAVTLRLVAGKRISEEKNREEKSRGMTGNRHKGRYSQ